MSKRGYLRSTEKERFWREVLRRQGKSGRSVREFCRGEGLKESAFYFWKRTIAERDREKSSSGRKPKTRRRARVGQRRKATVAATFMPLSIVGETPRLEIVAPDGWQVRVPDGINAQTLSDAIAALRQASGQETA
jgi:hypothetical protein